MPQKEREYLVLGKFVHRALELFHLAQIAGSTLPHNKQMTISFREAKKEYLDSLTPEIDKEAWQYISDYLKIIYTDKTSPLSVPVKAAEETFFMNLNDTVILNGMIDRIQIDPDGIIHVCDYKTTKNKKYLKDDFFQLLTYAFVMFEKHPEMEVVRCSYVLIRHGFEFITKEFTKAEASVIRQQYLDYTAEILQETEFPAHPTGLCNFCSYQEHCEEGMQKFYYKIPEHTGETSW